MGARCFAHALDVQSLRRNYRGRVHRVRRIRGAYALVSTGTALQLAHLTGCISEIRATYSAVQACPHGALISSFNGKKMETLADFESGWPPRGRRAGPGPSRDSRGPPRESTQAGAHRSQVVPCPQVQARTTCWESGLASPSEGPAGSSVKNRFHAVRQNRRCACRFFCCPSLVLVTFDMPYSVSGVTENSITAPARNRGRQARLGGDRPKYRRRSRWATRPA